MKASDSPSGLEKTKTGNVELCAEDAERCAVSPVNHERLFADKYELLEVIGSGGAGTVHKARHLFLNRVVALKVLNPDHSGAEGMRRFQQEARAASLLNHPNIVHVQDFGVSAQGQPYMAMDYVEGVPLLKFIQQQSTNGAGDITEKINLFIQVGNALSHAHEHNIVHRDIKPSNILVTMDEDAIPHAIVVDFGIAKILHSNDARSDLNLTHTGDVFGTPLYMSPEQCQGYEVDARADIYALGCVMYEAFNGTAPFVGASVYHTVAMQIQDAPPPFCKQLQSTDTGRRLEAIVLKALAKSPPNRYPFMLDLVSELKHASICTGAFGEILLRWKVVAGRFNALQRKTAIYNYLLICLSALACVIACNLFFLPDVLKQVCVQADRSGEIIDEMTRVIDSKQPAMLLLTGHKSNGDYLDVVQDLVQGHPDEIRIFTEFRHWVNHANELTVETQHDFGRSLMNSGGVFDARQVLRTLQEDMSEVVTAWAQATKESTKLVAICYNNLSDAKAKLEFYTALFQASLIGGIMDCLLLPAILGSLWLGRRNARAYYTGAQEQPKQKRAPDDPAPSLG